MRDSHIRSAIRSSSPATASRHQPARKGLRRAAPGLVSALVLCNSLSASATSVRTLDLPQMVQQSSLIVVGTVVAAESVWMGRDLHTRYTVEVEETLYGDTRKSVTVLVPGGVDRSRPLPIAVSVDGAPVFFAQERAVLLLDHVAQAGDYRIVGFNQGRFTVAVASGQTNRAASGAARLASPEPLGRLRGRLQELVRQRRAGQGPALSARPGRRP